ncbi:MAG TPA: adenosylcobinamide-GDP ribazoletransferase [Acidimicrobiales bacterium]|nr:adenosylcobinamide-GDP ribazoletransferase [Acidimicrobiales bacterium]
MRSALSFLTVVGGARDPDPGTLDWFPVVGAALGLVLGGWWWVVGRAWPAPVAAGLVLAADLGVTGLLHLDGLVDSGDGLLAPLSRGRRLEVMRQPEVGAFGVGSAAIVLVLRWAALAVIRPGVLLIGGLWCASRTLIAGIARLRPYARPEGGLPAAFEGPVHPAVLVSGMIAAIGLAAGWRPGPGVVAVAAGALGGLAVVALAERRLGGYTGDVLGAVVMVTETVGLVVASARW